MPHANLSCEKSIDYAKNIRSIHEQTVPNLTDQKIPAVRIFYKFYMEDEAAYVGGITYTAKITNLDAGTSQTITPSHYLKGSSKIMMVRTYDTAD